MTFELTNLSFSMIGNNKLKIQKCNVCHTKHFLTHNHEAFEEIKNKIQFFSTPDKLLKKLRGNSKPAFTLGQGLQISDKSILL